MTSFAIFPDLRGAKSSVGLPNGKIAVRKFALEGGQLRKRLCWISEVGLNAARTFLRRYRSPAANATRKYEYWTSWGQSPRPENGTEDVARNLLIRAGARREKGQYSVGCHCSRVKCFWVRACLMRLPPPLCSLPFTCRNDMRYKPRYFDIMWNWLETNQQSNQPSNTHYPTTKSRAQQPSCLDTHVNATGYNA